MKIKGLWNLREKRDEISGKMKSVIIMIRNVIRFNVKGILFLLYLFVVLIKEISYNINYISYINWVNYVYVDFFFILVK